MLKTFKALDVAKFIIRRHAVPVLDFINYGSKSAVHVAESTKDPRITLINADENVSILNLSEAQKISKTKSLKLVKITDLDVKTRRPLYRLISTEDYFKAQIQSRIDKKEAKKEWSLKGEKTISMSARIGEHDFTTSCNKITKWLDKCYSVRVVINGESKLQNAEDFMTKIVKECGENAKVQQKSLKGSTVKFNIVPLPPKPSTESNSNESNSDEIKS